MYTHLARLKWVIYTEGIQCIIMAFCLLLTNYNGNFLTIELNIASFPGLPCFFFVLFCCSAVFVQYNTWKKNRRTKKWERPGNEAKLNMGGSQYASHESSSLQLLCL